MFIPNVESNPQWSPQWVRSRKLHRCAAVHHGVGQFEPNQAPLPPHTQWYPSGHQVVTKTFVTGVTPGSIEFLGQRRS